MKGILSNFKTYSNKELGIRTDMMEFWVSPLHLNGLIEEMKKKEWDEASRCEGFGETLIDFWKNVNSNESQTTII